MSINTQESLEAFYGGFVPKSQVSSLTRPIMKCVECLIGDFKGEIQGKIPDRIMKKGILSSLKTMHQLGAEHPNIYTSKKNSIYVNSCKAGVACIKKHMEIDERIRADQEEIAKVSKLVEQRSKVAAEIYRIYGAIRAKYIEVGLDDDLDLKSYLGLLDVDLGMELYGYALYLVVWKIPTESGIYYHDRVIEAHNKHPIIKKILDRKKPTLTTKTKSKSMGDSLKNAMTKSH